MPLRAIGYVASAVTLAASYFPKAQVQMVHTLHTAERVNGRNISRTTEQARHFALLSGLVLREGQAVTHLTDTTGPIVTDYAAILDAISGLPEMAKEKLLAGGASRKHNIAYIAAHVDMHDTTAELLPLRAEDPAPIHPSRIISIGAQSERPFYLARMACREQGIAIPGRVNETGQLFTRHVLPPYRMCREGEPHIDKLDRTHPLRQPLEWDYDPLYDVTHPNRSVARDLAHIAYYLSGQDDTPTQIAHFVHDAVRGRHA